MQIYKNYAYYQIIGNEPITVTLYPLNSTELSP